jgi:hypothetical protein
MNTEFLLAFYKSNSQMQVLWSHCRALEDNNNYVQINLYILELYSMNWYQYVLESYGTNWLLLLASTNVSLLAKG